MKKIISLLLASATALCLVFSAGCGDKTPEVFETIDKVGLYTETELTLIKGVTEENLAVTSSDESVIEVDGTVLFAKSNGKATITAKFGDKVQKTKIKVVDNGERPVIETEDIPLLQGSRFKPQFTASFQNKELKDVIYSLSSDNVSVVEIDGDVMCAKNVGEATITVTAKYRGIDNVATASFKSKINENEAIVTEKNAYDLFAKEKVANETFTTKIPLKASVYSKGEEKTVDINWSIADETVAKIENSELVAVNLGSTTLVASCSYDGKTVKTSAIPITVNPSVIKTENTLLVDLQKTEAAFNPNDVYKSDDSLGKIITAKGDIITLNENQAASSAFVAGESRVTVYSQDGKFGAEVNLVAADFVVNNEADLVEMYKYASGYIALGCNIQMTEIFTPYKEEQVTFTGTFNGMGYTITGLKVKAYRNAANEVCNGALFTYINNFTIKNLALKSAKIVGGDGIGALVYRSEGANVIDNVYIECDMSGAGQWCGGAVAFAFRGSLKISNSVIKSDTSSVSNPDKNGAVLGRLSASFEMADSYVISGGTICSIGAHANNGNNAQANNLSVLYVSAAEFKSIKDKEDSVIDLSGFNDYWDLSKDVPCFKSSSAQ